MADFIVRLYSDSLIRLSGKPYEDAVSRRDLFLGFPYAQVAVFDQFVPVQGDVNLATGLIIQVKLSASDIDAAVGQAVGVAGHVLSMMSCVAMCAVGSPRPIWIYDASPGVEHREYRHYVYDIMDQRPRRLLNDQHLIKVMEQNYNSFLANSSLKDDFKARVQQGMLAFKRGLADNDDVLTEFLIAWATMEGLDCVYCKVLPAANVRAFKDGMKDVFTRLSRPEVFTPLESLRNEIAHGSLSLAQATQTARDHLELVRQALVFMILRILKVEEPVATEIIAQAGYKGKFQPHMRLLATISFDPVDVQNRDAQPQVKVWRAGEKYAKTGDTLNYEPDLRFEPQNLKGMTPYGTELWGEPGAPLRVHGHGVRVISKEEGSTG